VLNFWSPCTAALSHRLVGEEKVVNAAPTVRKRRTPKAIQRLRRQSPGNRIRAPALPGNETLTKTSKNENKAHHERNKSRVPLGGRKETGEGRLEFRLLRDREGQRVLLK